MQFANHTVASFSGNDLCKLYNRIKWNHLYRLSKQHRCESLAFCNMWTLHTLAIFNTFVYLCTIFFFFFTSNLLQGVGENDDLVLTFSHLKNLRLFLFQSFQRIFFFLLHGRTYDSMWYFGVKPEAKDGSPATRTNKSSVVNRQRCAEFQRQITGFVDVDNKFY